MKKVIGICVGLCQEFLAKIDLQSTKVGRETLGKWLILIKGAEVVLPDGLSGFNELVVLCKYLEDNTDSNH